MMSFKCWLAVAAAAAAVKEIKQEQRNNKRRARQWTERAGGRSVGWAANGEREEERMCCSQREPCEREKGFYTKRRDESSARENRSWTDGRTPFLAPSKNSRLCVSVCDRLANQNANSPPSRLPRAPRNNKLSLSQIVLSFFLSKKKKKKKRVDAMKNSFALLKTCCVIVISAIAGIAPF